MHIGELKKLNQKSIDLVEIADSLGSLFRKLERTMKLKRTLTLAILGALIASRAVFGDEVADEIKLLRQGVRDRTAELDKVTRNVVAER